MDFSPAVSKKRNQLAKTIYLGIVRENYFGIDPDRAADRAIELATAFTARCLDTCHDAAAENEAPNAPENE